MKKPIAQSLELAFGLMVAGAGLTANAATLLQTGDAGYYNTAIGALLDGTNGGESGPFPVNDDSALTFPTAPDLSAAAGVLGNWLTDPAALNANWIGPGVVPSSWDVGSEMAVVYAIETAGATDVVASIGVDNGVSVWLDGQYRFGARASGSAVPGEYLIGLGDLAAGRHYLQLMLEDHSITNGFAVQVTGNEMTPAVPEPSTVALLAAGLAVAGAGGAMRRRRRAG